MRLPEHVEHALRDYDLRRDRATPPVFVGRKDELDFLHGTVAAAKAGAEGITAVVQGVPGAGKSALCGQFENEAAARGSEQSPVAVLSKPWSVLDSPPVGMVKELTADVPVRLDLLQRLPGLENFQEHVGRAVGAATALMKRGSSVDLAMQAMNLDQSSTLGAALDAFAARMWPAGITLLLSIDEMQGVEDTPLVRRNLAELHAKRFDVNVAVVCFGLHDTAAKLRALGLSRLGTGQIRRLGALAPADAADLVDETFDCLGLKSADDDWQRYATAHEFGVDDWTRWRRAAKAAILAESAGFPHHLVNGVRAVCKLVLNGELRYPGDRQLRVVRRRCRESKAEYYAARLEPFAEHTMALAAALKQVDARGEVDSAVVRDALEESDNGGRAVDGQVAAAVLSGLLARGLLARTRRTMVGVETPSLTGYLTDEFDQSLASGGRAAARLAEAFGIGQP